MDRETVKERARRWPWIVAGVGTVTGIVGIALWFQRIPCLTRRYSFVEAIGLNLLVILAILGPLVGWIATPIVATIGRKRRAVRVATWTITAIVAAFLVAAAIAAGINLKNTCGSGQIPSDFPSMVDTELPRFPP